MHVITSTGQLITEPPEHSRLFCLWHENKSGMDLEIFKNLVCLT